MSSVAKMIETIETEMEAQQANPEHLRMVEALLFAASEPLDPKALSTSLPEGADVPALLKALQEEYEKRGVNLCKIAGKYQFRTAADLAFLWNAPFNDKLSFRGGFGLGIGVVIGDVLQTDSTCTAGADNLQEDCMVNPNAVKKDEPADLPPVLPVVDLLAGLQWKPASKLTVNLDTGFRSAPFIGLSSVFFF